MFVYQMCFCSSNCGALVHEKAHKTAEDDVQEEANETTKGEVDNSNFSQLILE
jgi:hypothetical protein